MCELTASLTGILMPVALLELMHGLSDCPLLSVVIEWPQGGSAVLVYS